MFRRPLAILVVALLAAALPAAALAARVTVRVEGKTQTIFGATEPVLNVKANALDALEAASVADEFYYHVTRSGLGAYVDQVGRYPAVGSSGWFFKVNGASPPVGADQVTLKDGDRVVWYWGTFGPPPTFAAPATLRLVRQARNCYRVLAEDDSGKTSPAVGAVLRVGRRSVKTRNGRACIGRHRGLVRATLRGAIRSNAVR